MGNRGSKEHVFEVMDCLIGAGNEMGLEGKELQDLVREHKP